MRAKYSNSGAQIDKILRHRLKIIEKSLGEEFLGVAISETKVQPYKCSASGFIPDGSSVFAAGLKVLKIIESSDYFYVSKGSLMYLKLKV